MKRQWIVLPVTLAAMWVVVLSAAAAPPAADGSLLAANIQKPVETGLYCGPGFTIPDNDPAGNSSTLSLGDDGVITDMDVILSVDHTFVGDLIVTLTNEDSGASSVLVHRPGGPPAPYCDGDDIDATLDDEAASSVEYACAPTPPTISGDFRPMQPLDTFDLLSLEGDWTLHAVDKAANDVGEVLSWCLEPKLPAEPIKVEVTVGVTPGQCATTQHVDAHPGEEVTYCYTVTNDTETTLTSHDLTDDQLGQLLDDYAFSLEPGESTFVTASAVVSETVTNTATWTAEADSGRAVSGSDSATVYVVPVGCSMPLLDIPDHYLFGITDDIVFSEGGEIGDIDIYVQVEHTFVGDLSLTVEHLETDTSVTILERPGGPPSPYCSGDDIDATLDDEADEPVEEECAATVPTIAGRFIPNNPLSAFDGEDLAGTWRIQAADLIQNDVGTLIMWCVQATAGPPVINVPPELSSTQPPESVVDVPFTITNDGGSNLEWSLSEDAGWATLSDSSGVTGPAGSTTIDVTFDAAGLPTGNYTGTLTVTSDDPVTPIVTVPLLLTVACEDACLRVTEIRLNGRQQGGNAGVNARVFVQDENGDPVAGATVTANWTVNLASGPATIQLPTAVTNDNGIARFTLRAGLGTYAITIAAVEKDGYTFDPDNSVLEATITLPPGRAAQ